MFNHALSRYNVIIVKNFITYSSIIISASIFQTVYICKLHRLSRIWKTLSHVQQFFTNNGINATITLNQATDRISIRSDQNVFLVFPALIGFSSSYIITANTTHFAPYVTATVVKKYHYYSMRNYLILQYKKY